MTEVAGTKFAGNAEPALMPHDAQIRDAGARNGAATDRGAAI